MKKLITLIALSASLAGVSLLTSCGGCCTGEELAPPLRPAPDFSSQSVTPAPVIYQK